MTGPGNAWAAVGMLAPVVWIGALIAAGGTIAGLMPLFGRFALAVPTARSSHRSLTPQWGGLAAIAATLGAAALAALVSPALAADSGRLWLVLAAALLLALLGAVDDVRGLGAAPKLAAQAVAVALLLAALPLDVRLAPALPPWLERGILLVGCLWLVNLVNFMDGIDWIMVAEVVPVTAGAALIGAFGALPPEGLVVALALNGAMLGFAPFNRPVARLFLGDMGSLPIGLLIAWLMLLIAGLGHVAAALLLPLYFVADATVTLFRRLLNGERVWEAHRTHFYQRAADNGWSNMEIVGRIFAVNVGLVALAAVSVILQGPGVDVAAVLSGAALVAWLIVGFARKRP